MRTILILAAGVWIGREVFTTIAKNQAREREVKVRKKLEQFIKESLPALQPPEIQKEVENILEQKPI